MTGAGKDGSAATVADLLGVLEALAPAALAEEWDNVGLLVGSDAAPATRVLVALDLRDGVLDDAERDGCDVVLTHHPPIFPTLTSVTDRTAAGRLVTRAIRGGIAVVSAHTNLDSARGGLNDVMCDLLSVGDTRPLVPASGDASVGLGRVGGFDGTLDELTQRCRRAFGGAAVHGVVGDPAQRLSTVAVCTGSGGSFIDAARASGADAYVTGDLKYHDADRAEGMALVNVGHAEVEGVALDRWARTLALHSPGITITTAATTSPWGREGMGRV